MKKILLAMGAMLLSLNISAASDLVFCDKDGNEIADGSTLTMKDVTVNEFEETQIALNGVYVKNTTSSAVSGSMTVTVAAFPGGAFQCCFGDNCRTVNTPEGGSMSLTGVAFAANQIRQLANTEWVVEAEKYGTCPVVLEISGGPKLNVNFVYAASAIKNVNADNNACTKKSCKAVKSGQLVILNNNHQYTVSGAQVR